MEDSLGGREYISYANERNTYSSGEDPVRIDYLMHWAAPTQHLKMSTSGFALMHFNTTQDDGKVVSLSDHEALMAEYTVVQENQIPSIEIEQVVVQSESRS